MAWAPDYVTVDDAADYLRIGDTDDDVLLGYWVTAASRAIDRACGRQFGSVSPAEDRIYRGRPVWSAHHQLWLVDVDDVQDITGMTIDGEDLVTAGATMLPDNASADGMPYTAIGFDACPEMPLTASAPWGWAEFPQGVVSACLLQVARFAVRRDSPFGVAGSPQTGSELRLLARLDPDVAVMLRPFLRRRLVA